MSVDPRTLPVRFSRLKLLGQSPAHYRHACQGDSPGTTSTRRGSGVHAVVLGTPYAVWPARRAGGAWEAFEADNAGIPIMNTAEHEAALAMRDQVVAHQLANSLLYAPGMTVEKVIDWDINGRACRGTPDAHGHGVLIDFKTTRCAEPERFIRDAKWRGYGAQLSWYAAGLRRNGIDVSKLYIVAVEAVAPHPVTVFELDGAAWLAGEAQCAAWFERLAICESANHWPGYTDAAVRFSADDDATGLIIDGNDFEF